MSISGGDRVTTDSPVEETAREFARWLSGGVAGDMVTGWEDYWTAGIERRDAAGRAETETALRDLMHLVFSFELAWGTVGKPDREITGDAMALFDGLKEARAFLPETSEGATSG